MLAKSKGLHKLTLSLITEPQCGAKMVFINDAD